MSWDPECRAHPDFGPLRPVLGTPAAGPTWDQENKKLWLEGSGSVDENFFCRPQGPILSPNVPWGVNNTWVKHFDLMSGDDKDVY